MTTMVEKVAVAIREVNEKTVGLTYTQITKQMARAAIEAMMIPTPDMVIYGLNCDAWAEGGDSAVEMLSETFSAMIQAALKEGQE